MNNNKNKIQEYWIDRVSNIKEIQYQKVEKAEKQLKNLYAETNKHIRNEMFIFYSKYSDNQGITLAETQKLLKKDEMKEWKVSLEEYKELAHNKENKQYLDEMYIRSRISRLDALETQIQAEIRVLGEKQKDVTQNILENVYEDTYEKTTKIISNISGIKIRYDKFDKEELESLVKKPFQNSNFSSRIWEDKANLIEQLNTTLAQHIVLGKSPSQLADLFSKKMGTSYYKASRLLNTEAANITEQATLKSYKDTRVEEYEILATLDERTSDICNEMHGKRFKINEAKTGINYPPFHPNCRTTTVPITEIEEFFEEDNIISTNNIKSDKITSNSGNEEQVVQYIGKLDKEKLGKYGDKIVTEEIVLTDERMQHILEDHEKDYERIMNDLNNAVLNPDEVIDDIKNENTVFMVKKLDKNNLSVVVKLNVSNSKEHPKNSVMTAWIVRDKNLKKLEEKNIIIYKSE